MSRLPAAAAFACAALLVTPPALQAQGGPPPPPPGGAFPNPPIPPGNPLTAEKVALGKALFWEEQLSSTRTVSCGTCHIPAAGGSDPRTGLVGSTHPGFDGQFGTPDDVAGSPGVVASLANGALQSSDAFGVAPQVTGRKAPSMINAAFAPRLFWDGRAQGPFLDPLTGAVVLNQGALENQAAEPPVSDVEMAHLGRDWADVAQQLEQARPLALASDLPPALSQFLGERSYPELFEDAFGTPEVTPVRILLALASYERTLVSDQSPFDALQAGVPGALTPQQQQGLNVFNGPGRCNLCHAGPLFTNQSFRNIGVRPPGEDPGRGGVTGLAQDQGRFKVPSLRNVGLRAPFFHNGSAATLNDVVEFYDRGGDFPQNQDPLIQPLGLSNGQKNALVAFLGGALTDARVANGAAPFDRPTLYTESGHVPSEYGLASAGSGGLMPRNVALEPPLAGNPGFTLGLANAAGGSFAFFGLDTAPAVPGTQILGARLHLALTPALLFLPVGALPGVAPGEGFTSVTLSLPPDPNLVGAAVFSQWFVLDPTPAGLFAGTRGVASTLF